MPRLHATRHALPAVVVTALSVVAPLLFGGGSDVLGSAGSATARAAQHDPVQAPDVRFAVGSPALNTARDIAQQHWGTAPCGGNVEIVWVQLDGDTNATAAWRNPTDAWNNAGENFDCRIEFNAVSDYDWPKLCTVMTHEMGHLAGQPHSPNPGELMSPIYTDPLPACTGAEPGAPAPAPAAVAPTPEQEAAALRPAPRKKAATKRKPAAKKRTLTAKKKTKAKGSKRCTRVFRAGRRVRRCAKPRRRAGRIARARR